MSHCMKLLQFHWCLARGKEVVCVWYWYRALEDIPWVSGIQRFLLSAVQHRPFLNVALLGKLLNVDVRRKN